MGKVRPRKKKQTNKKKQKKNVTPTGVSPSEGRAVAPIRRSKKKREKKERAVHSQPVRAVVESDSPGTVSKGPDEAVHSQLEQTVPESDANTESRDSDHPQLVETVAVSVS